MLAQFSQQTQQFIQLVRAEFVEALQFLAWFWLIGFINALMGQRLCALGIVPRQWWSIPGIIFAPLLHSGFNHLFFNSIPLLFLSLLILIQGPAIFLIVTVGVTVLSGCLIWLFGRKAIYVGASALVMGYWSFLLTEVFHHQQPLAYTIILFVVCVFYFGGMLTNLFPQAKRVAWEGHLFGFVAGISVYYFLGDLAHIAYTLMR